MHTARLVPRALLPRALAAAAAAGMPLAGAAPAQTSLITLGHLPIPNNNIGRATAVSLDGRTVYGETSVGSSGVPWVWTAETGLRALPTLDGFFSFKIDASSPGGRHAAGTYINEALRTNVGCVWLGQSAVVPAEILPGTSGSSALYAVTSGGTAYGVVRLGDQDEGTAQTVATAWTEAGQFDILPPIAPEAGLDSSRINRVLADGRVSGNSFSTGSWFFDPDAGYEVVVPGVPVGFNREGTIGYGTRTLLSGSVRGYYWTRGSGVLDLPGQDDLPDASPGGGVLAASGDGRFAFGSIDGVQVLWVDLQAPVPFREYLANRGIDTDRIGPAFGVFGISGDGRVMVGEMRRPEWGPGRVEPFVLTIEPCPADASFDGLLTPEDFFAWVSAYQTGHIRCDQNGDGLCDSADFFAWVVGYAKGCP